MTVPVTVNVPVNGIGAGRAALTPLMSGLVGAFAGTRPHMGTDMDKATLAELGRQLRVDAVRAAGAAGSGHPTSSLSAADLMAVLITRHLRYDFTRPDDPRGDHLIFSKGHASPLLYAIYKAVGEDQVIAEIGRAHV